VTPNASEYSLSPDAAVLVMEDGSARIIDMGDCFYAVSPIGSLMLRETLENGPAGAVQKVVVEYAITPSQGEADLGRFLTNLERRGILLRRGEVAGRSSAGSPGARLLARMLKTVIRFRRSPKAQAAALLTFARLSLKLFGWAQTVRAWKRSFSLREGRALADNVEALAQRIDDAVCSAAAHHPLGVACKERALSCWALARRAGVSAALVIGVEHFPLSGHCWCQIGVRIVSDRPDNCARYVPVLRYD
jgi:hypothetical protein